MPSCNISQSQPDADFLRNARTAHLATADAAGRPHVIPVCFVFCPADRHSTPPSVSPPLTAALPPSSVSLGGLGGAIYVVLDQKPKSVPLTRLRRVRNILANPQVALVVDHYDEDWRNLRYVLVSGRGSLLEGGDEAAAAIESLRRKYPQYQDMDLDGNPVIKITPERFTPWSYTPEA